MQKNLQKKIYILQFIDSARFMVSSLSNLVNNFLKEFIKLNLNIDTMIKNIKLLEVRTKYATAILNTQTLKMF